LCDFWELFWNVVITSYRQYWVKSSYAKVRP
jgi:hypothetical protein